MPRFHCIHCGQSIDASGEWEGLSTDCPSCGGRIEVPRSESMVPAVPPLPPQLPAPPQGMGDLLRNLVIISTVVLLVVTFISSFISQAFISAAFGNVINYVPFAIRGFGVWFISSLVCTGLLAAVGGGISTALRKGFPKGFGISYVGAACIFALLAAGVMTHAAYKAQGSARIVAEKSRAAFGTPDYDEQYERRQAASDGILSKSPILPPPPTPEREKDLESLRKAVDSIREDALTLNSEFKDADGSPKQTDFKFEENKNPANTGEKMTSLTRSLFNDMGAVQQAYLADLEKAGMHELLDPVKLKGRDGIANARITLSEADKAVGSALAKAEALISDLPARVRKLGFGAEEAEILRGIQRGVRSSRSVMDENWRLERDTLRQMGLLVDLLESEVWQPEDGIYVFEDGGASDRFNGILAKIDANTKLQQDLQAKKFDESLEKLDRTRDELSQ